MVGGGEAMDVRVWGGKAGHGCVRVGAGRQSMDVLGLGGGG